jgi:hypothetical protein
MYRIILSLILVLINSSLISSQDLNNGKNMNKDDHKSNGISMKFLVIFIFFILLLILIIVGCIVSIRKKKQQIKNDLCKSITTTIVRKTNNDDTIGEIRSNKIDELDLENNWITDVYSNNTNLKKDIFGFKKKFYNLDNDSLQSVKLNNNDDENSKIMKSSGLSNTVTPPPYIYDPSSTPNVTLTLNETIPKKDLTEKALDFLIKNPPKDILPTQAEIHSILKVHENSCLNPYSSWKFIVENNVVEESGVVQIINYGKLVEINTRKWSSTTNDVCVQTNYPFFIPKSSSVRRNSISTTADRLNNVKNSSNHVKRNSSNAIKSITLREEVVHYFEVTILSKATDVDTIISIGLSTKPYPYFRLPGWNKHSIGYQSNNGNLYHNDINSGKEYALAYTVGDTVGCGYKPGTNEIFFTKNGDYLGPYTTSNFTNNPFINSDDVNLQHVWYPTIAANGQCKLEINFGGETSEGTKDLFKYKLARNFGPGAPLSVVKQLRGGELIGSYEKCKSENVELERVGL